MASRKKMSRTFEKLESSIQKLTESLNPDFQAKYEKDILIEIVTKRFEYTFETLWKVIKEILFEEGIDCASPLSCFKEAYKLGLITGKNEEIFPLMVKKRNEIVHIYSDEDAYEIYLLIKNSFFSAMIELYRAIQQRQAS